MDVTTGFLIYVTLFRIAIIAVGLISILVGYLLFIKDPVGQGKTTASIEKGGFKVTLKNFWPGVYFAAFGTAIIGIMLWQGNPELLIEELKTARDNTRIDEGSNTAMKIAIRGGCNDIDSCWALLSDPQMELAKAAQPISQIAAIWRKEGRKSEALTMARLAVRIEPQNPTYLAQLAWLFLENNEPENALEVMEVAAKIDNAFENELTNLRANLK